MTAKISVIIPCFNTNEEIHNMTVMAVESIKRARSDVEMIIIDNGSTYAPGYLREVADIYVRNQSNLGYPGAVNQGLALASGDILCISNNDIRVPENIFDVGMGILSGENTGSVHFKMIPYDEPFNFGNEIWLTEKERWCTASFFMVKKEAIPKGGYDLNFGMGGYDDWALFHELRHLNGWLTAYTNKSAYQHWGSWTLSKVPDFDKSTKNSEYFKSKYGEYAEDIWNKRYPGQMVQDYYKGFE